MGLSKRLAKLEILQQSKNQGVAILDITQPGNYKLYSGGIHTKNFNSIRAAKEFFKGGALIIDDV